MLERIASARWESKAPLSAQLSALFEKAFAKHPKNRFPTAGAFAGELLRYQLDCGLADSPGAVSEIDFASFTPMSGTGLLQIPPGDGTRAPVLQRLPEPASATLALPGSPALFVNRGLRQVKDRP